MLLLEQTYRGIQTVWPLLTICIFCALWGCNMSRTGMDLKSEVTLMVGCWFKQKEIWQLDLLELLLYTRIWELMPRQSISVFLTQPAIHNLIYDTVHIRSLCNTTTAKFIYFLWLHLHFGFVECFTSFPHRNTSWNSCARCSKCPDCDTQSDLLFQLFPNTQRIFKMFFMVINGDSVPWLTQLPHSKKVLGLNLYLHESRHAG